MNSTVHTWRKADEVFTVHDFTCPLFRHSSYNFAKTEPICGDRQAVSRQGQVRDRIRLLDWTRICFDLPGHRRHGASMRRTSELSTQLQLSSRKRIPHNAVVPLGHDGPRSALCLSIASIL